MTAAEKQQPWGKWFWGDWRKDARLRRCCYASRGLWADMLSLMGGECDRFGFLIMEGQPLGASDLVGLLGGTEREVSKSLAELGKKRVYSVTGAADMEPDLLVIIPADMPAGVIFSRRMVRDKAKADRDRENGKTGGNPTLKVTVKRGVNPPDKAQKLEPEPEAKGEDSLGEFDSFFAVFPKQEQRDNAEREFAKALESGATAADLLDGAKRFATHVAREKIPLRFVALAKTWLSDGCWKDRYGEAEQSLVLPPLDPSWPAEEVKRWSKNLGEINFRTYFGPAEFIDCEPRVLRYRSANLRGLAQGHFPQVAREVALEVAA
jgi:hypothetical protein